MKNAEKSNKSNRPSARFARPADPSRRRSAPASFPKGAWIVILGLVACFGAMIYWSQRPASNAASDIRTDSRAQDGRSRAAGSLTNAPDTQNAKTKEQEASGLNLLGNNLLKAGDLPGAIRAYKQAIALTPGDEDLHFNLGIAHAQADDFTNAETEYKEALRLLPEYPEVHNNLGNLLLRQGRLEEAEGQLNEAIKDMPDYSQAHNNLGILRQKQRRAEEAIASFKKAVETDTNYWQAHFNLASAYLMLTNKEAAIAELKETLRINPGFPPALKAMAKVEDRGTGTNQVPQ